MQARLVKHIKRMHESGLYKRPGGKLRINGTEICCSYFRHIGMSDEALAAGMTEERQLIEVRIAGNTVTDPAMATTLAAIETVELSFDSGATWQACNVDGTIKNTGLQWVMRLEL